MRKQIRYGLLAVVASFGVTGTVYADSAKTLGGIVVTSDDGNFVGSLGGRIHFDYTGIMPGKGSGFDSGAGETDSGFYFRRVFISLSGRIYGWRYRIDEDISNTSNPAAGFQDLYISHDIGDDYGTVRIGQTRPWRGVDYLVSNNDKIFTERNVNTDSGLYGNRAFELGVFYRYSHHLGLLSHDNFWGGVSVYSLNNAGSTTDQGTGTPTQGLGYNARIAYAPIAKPGEWLHFGANFSSDHADNGSTLSAGSSVWYSYKGITQNVVSMKGTQPATTGTLANIPGGNNPSQNTLLGEVAATFGPVYFLAEGGGAIFRQPTFSATNPNKQRIYSYAVETSLYLTGESKIYDAAVGSYASPKPLHSFGAIEVALGYDTIANTSLPKGDTGATGAACAPALGSIPKGTTITRCQISYGIAGINYYANSNMRFMLDYNYGVFNLGDAGKDIPRALNARFQLAF